jgi:hypothetical protein
LIVRGAASRRGDEVWCLCTVNPEETGACTGRIRPGKSDVRIVPRRRLYVCASALSIRNTGLPSRAAVRFSDCAQRSAISLTGRIRGDRLEGSDQPESRHLILEALSRLRPRNEWNCGRPDSVLVSERARRPRDLLSRRGRRVYRTLRIPEPLFRRVITRLTRAALRGVITHPPPLSRRS